MTTSCQLAGQDCPICGPVYEHIAEADTHQLIRIAKTTIPHLKGITDAQRTDLQQAVRERFGKLNAAAVPQKGRW